MCYVLGGASHPYLVALQTHIRWHFGPILGSTPDPYYLALQTNFRWHFRTILGGKLAHISGTLDLC